MISQKYRFHGHGSLNFLFKNGEQKRGKLFGIKYVKNTHRKSPRVAVVVSKKISKKAVDRNRIRRRIFEAIRTNFDFEKQYDFTITVFSKEVMEMPHAELVKQLNQLLSELK